MVTTSKWNDPDKLSKLDQVIYSQVGIKLQIQLRRNKKLKSVIDHSRAINNPLVN